MNYKYDIFISYRRDDLTRKWIQTHFIPLLEHHVHLELGRTPTVFIDDQLETGTTWPITLGSILGNSRTIIPLWTKTFLDSVWCCSEIGHMLERESNNGFRTIDNPGGLIFPIVIHDGETMPVQLNTIQKLEIQECYNVRMSVDSPKAEILADKLRLVGRVVAEAILNAPAWQANWQINAVTTFVEQFHNRTGSFQRIPPKFTN